MKNLRNQIYFLLLICCFSCKDNFIESTTNKPAKDIKSARKMLTDKKKWAIEEAYFNNALVYYNGKNLGNDSEIDLEYCSFWQDGTFAVKSIGDNEDTSLKYTMDLGKNEIAIFDENGYFDDFKINAGSVFEKSFTMSVTETDGGIPYTIKLKMKAIE